MNEEPLVSVIIPVYNRYEETKRAIDSVLNQSYNNLELLLIDDCSSDKNIWQMLQVYEKCWNGKIRIFQTSESHGFPSYARNIGIKNAKGKFIALLDNDDYWMPDKLEKQMNLFKYQPLSVGLIYSGIRKEDLKTGKVRVNVYPKYRGYVYEQILYNNFILNLTVVIRKEVFDKVGLYDEKCLMFEDRDMHTRIAKYYRVDYVPELLAVYSEHPKQLSHTINRVKSRLYYINKFYEDLIRLPKALAFHFHFIGCNYYLDGNVKEAVKFEKFAFRQHKKPLYLITIIIMLTSRKLFNYFEVKRRKRWGVKNV